MNITCPMCGTEIKIADESYRQGIIVNCPSCNGQFDVNIIMQGEDEKKIVDGETVN